MASKLIADICIGFACGTVAALMPVEFRPWSLLGGCTACIILIETLNWLVDLIVGA